MKNLVIISARNFAREIYNLAIETKEYADGDFRVKGFLDINPDALHGYDNYPKILNSTECYTPETNDVFICAVGDANSKKELSSIILEKGGQFINLIHPTARIGTNVKIGKGCIISYNVSISCDVTIGDFVTFQPFCTIGHDAKIDDWCHLNTYSFMGGFSEMEKCATIHTGGILLPSKKIGENSVLGAGSVALKNIKPDATSFGVPAVNICF